MKNDEKEIFELATVFIEYVLGKKEPKGWCFTVCYPLSIYLNLHGHDTKLVVGKYEGTHSWVLINGSNNIVDPTIKQFSNWKSLQSIEGIFLTGQETSDVYLGPKPLEFITQELEFRKWFEFYKDWMLPFEKPRKYSIMRYCAKRRGIRLPTAHEILDVCQNSVELLFQANQHNSSLDQNYIELVQQIKELFDSFSENYKYSQS